MSDIDYKLKNEFEFYRKESERCAKSYSDWKNDETNCLDNKYLWGITVEGRSTGPASFQTLNYLDLYYNRRTKLYFLDIDLSHWAHPEWKDSDYLFSLLKLLKNYIESITGESLSAKEYLISTLDFHTVPDMFNDTSLEKLYYKFYLFIMGFCAAQISD